MRVKKRDGHLGQSYTEHSRAYVVGISVDRIKVLVALGTGNVEVLAHFVNVVLILVISVIVLIFEFLKINQASA